MSTATGYGSIGIFFLKHLSILTMLIVHSQTKPVWPSQFDQ
jgi:hypothetical protein